MLSHPWYALIVIAHVLVAVIGFSALAMTGAYARLAQHSADPFNSANLRRYFQPGHNLAARAIYLVPIFGGVALGFSHDTHKLYPYIGIGLWLVATGIASAMLWPAESEIQLILADGIPDNASLAKAAGRCERAAMMTSILFVGALFVMIAQPN